MSHLLHASDGLRLWARRLVGWMLVLLLLAALAPAISRALAAEAVPGSRPGGHWVTLCTSQGMQWVRVDLGDSPDGDSPAPAPSPEALDRCGHCTLATERFAPLIRSLPTLLPVSGSWALPRLVTLPTVGTPARAAVARGPPLLT